jgi:hypothetical protein
MREMSYSLMDASSWQSLRRGRDTACCRRSVGCDGLENVLHTMPGALTTQAEGSQDRHSGCMQITGITPRGIACTKRMQGGCSATSEWWSRVERAQLASEGWQTRLPILSDFSSRLTALGRQAHSPKLGCEVHNRPAGKSPCINERHD